MPNIIKTKKDTPAGDIDDIINLVMIIVVAQVVMGNVSMTTLLIAVVVWTLV